MLIATCLELVGSIVRPLTFTGSLERYCVPFLISYLRRQGELT